MNLEGKSTMLKFAKLDPRAVSPGRKHPEDAGIDVYALEACSVAPFSHKVLRTGVTFDVPAGTFLLVKPKGRNNHLTGSGVIDAGYQGEILIKVEACGICAGDTKSFLGAPRFWGEASSPPRRYSSTAVRLP